MHQQAEDFVRCHTAARTWNRVLELGSRNVNGTARDFVSSQYWWGIDLIGGDGVDEVADARYWRGRDFDLVLCLETFEHTDGWLAILATMRFAVKKDGLAIVTTACEPRVPHSAVDGEALREGEYYANVEPAALLREAVALFAEVDMSVVPGDVRMAAKRIAV